MQGFKTENRDIHTTEISEYVISVMVGRDRSVGITTRYGLDGSGIESRWRGEIFCARQKTVPGAPPASYTFGTGSFPRVKRPGRGVDHPPQLAPRLKKQ